MLQSGKPAPCPALPQPYTGDLNFPSKYDGSGPARDVVSPRAEEAYKQGTAAITAFEQAAATLTDAYMRSGDGGDLICLLTLYKSWADARALEQDAANYAGKSIRKWALATAAGAYLRLARSTSQPLAGHAPEDAAIRAWLSRVGDRVMQEWDLDAPDERINNQTYWAGWALTATAAVTGRGDLLAWGMKALRRGLSQIDADGFLQTELKRDSRALAYHSYALQPLTQLFAFASANHVAGIDQGALARLIGRTVSGIDDPQPFAAKAGEAQLLDRLQSPQTYIWLEAWCATITCSGDLIRRLQASRPLHTNRLGGSMTAVYGPTK